MAMYLTESIGMMVFSIMPISWVRLGAYMEFWV